MTLTELAPTGSTFGEFDEPATWTYTTGSIASGTATKPLTDMDLLDSNVFFSGARSHIAGGPATWMVTPLRRVEGAGSAIRDAVAKFDTALAASSSLRLFVLGRHLARTVEVLMDRPVSFDWLIETTNQPRDGDPLFDLTLPVPEPLAEQPAVTVVNHLVELLDMPKRDVLAAAGISKSTFHTWDKPHGPRPRVSSQGQLWALAEAVEDLGEYLGGASLVGPWLHADDRRGELLRDGDFDELIALAVPASSSQPRRWLSAVYGAGPERLEPLMVTGPAAQVRRGRSAARGRRSSGRSERG